MKNMSRKINDTLIRAYNGEQTDYTPAWYMRQAGRSQREYLEIRKKHTLFEITHDPELCAYVTRLPVEDYGNDGAILYKDIMSSLPAMGVDVEIKSGIGPVIDNPIRTIGDINKLTPLNPLEDVPYVLDTIRLLTEDQLYVPLIGFSGAPFTLGSYMIEGGPSNTYSETKAFMYSNPEAWVILMDKLGDVIISYRKASIDPGAQAIRPIDACVGASNGAYYRR